MELDMVFLLELDGNGLGRDGTVSLYSDDMTSFFSSNFHLIKKWDAVFLSYCRSYLVGIPAILESGAETNFCASLLHPNETLTMTVFLNSEEENITLFKETSSKDFHKCHKFKVSFKKKKN